MSRFFAPSTTDERYFDSPINHQARFAELGGPVASRQKTPPQLNPKYLAALQKSPCPRNPSSVEIGEAHETKSYFVETPTLRVSARKAYLRPPSPPRRESIGKYVSPLADSLVVDQPTWKRSNKRVSPLCPTGLRHPISCLPIGQTLHRSGLDAEEGDGSENELHPFDFGNDRDVFENEKKCYFEKSRETKLLQTDTPNRRSTYEAGYISGLRSRKRSSSSSSASALHTREGMRLQATVSTSQRHMARGLPSTCDVCSSEKLERQNHLNGEQSEHGEFTSYKSPSVTASLGPFVVQVKVGPNISNETTGNRDAENRTCGPSSSWELESSADLKPLIAMDGTTFQIHADQRAQIFENQAGGFAPPPGVMADALEAMSKLLLLTERSLDRHYACSSRWKAVATESKPLPSPEPCIENRWDREGIIAPATCTLALVPSQPKKELNGLGPGGRQFQGPCDALGSLSNPQFDDHTWPAPVFGNSVVQLAQRRTETASGLAREPKPPASATSPLAGINSSQRISNSIIVTNAAAPTAEPDFGGNDFLEDGDLLQQLLEMLSKQKEQHDRELSELAEVVAELKRAKIEQPK